MELYKVGTIVNTHGIKGEVRVMATTDFPTERFQVGNQLVIAAKPAVEVEIASVRKHKQFVLLSFAGMQDINLVEKYKGLDLMVSETKAPRLADDEYFYHDLIGLQVIDNHTKAQLGQVQEILEMPANDVWVVKGAGQEMLLPFTEQVVIKIDLAANVAYVNQLEEWVADEN
ncbi:rimM protein [Weissella kandleri]|uniref:Ribosome maturation factor RimM n=1 Tax=Weissella kandleri TaxID=1616 RepID=A0A0R2JCG5_9LACO|nr:ribosome maturation factor RimM [Weissella kandleri]KRN75016.1 rimM protein [Weissella kandleri]